MAKDAYYFSHDSSSQDDPKCMLLIDQLGMEGYGIFWALIEKLRTESEFKLPMIIIGMYAKRWGTSKEKIEAVIKNYSLFEVEEEKFFSKRLIFTMQRKMKNAKAAADIRWGNNIENQLLNADALQEQSERIALGVQNDAKKGKERKGKENIESRVLGLSPQQNFLNRKKWFAEQMADFKEKYPRELLMNFYEYWTEPNKSKTKMRFELEKTWDLNLRLKKWASNNFGNNKIEKKESQVTIKI